MSQQKSLLQLPSERKPWLRYYTEKDIRIRVPQCTVYALMHSRNAHTPRRVALLYGDTEITYDSLFRSIECAASAFAALGVHEGEVVTICSYTIPELIYSFYALNMLGAVCNFIDPRTNDDRIRQILEMTGCRVALVWEDAASRFIHFREEGRLEEIILLSPSDSIPGHSAPESDPLSAKRSFLRFREFLDGGADTVLPVFPYQKDRPAVILYTSGTTGSPKGVILSNEALNAVTVEYACGLDFKTGQRFLNIMPPFVASGLTCGINMILGIGLTSILVPKFNPDRFVDLFKKYKPEHMFGVPAYFEKLFQDSEIRNMDLSFVGMMAAGGDALAPELEIQFNQILREHHGKTSIAKGYGLTELGFAATTTKAGVNKLGSVGIPLPLTTISVRDPMTREELPFDSEGEIYITSPSSMSGYLGMPEEEQDVFWTDRQGVRWIKTGDMGFMDEDGFLFLKGRIKRMIIRPDGHNVWPSQIEEVILRHPAVHQCIVVGLASSDIRSGKIPTAFIVKRPDILDDDRSLLLQIDRFCRDHMPERDMATAYLFINEIPLTPAGKVDYQVLEHMFNKQIRQQVFNQ